MTSAQEPYQFHPTEGVSFVLGEVIIIIKFPPLGNHFSHESCKYLVVVGEGSFLN